MKKKEATAKCQGCGEVKRQITIYTCRCCRGEFCVKCLRDKTKHTPTEVRPISHR